MGNYKSREEKNGGSSRGFPVFMTLEPKTGLLGLKSFVTREMLH